MTMPARLSLSSFSFYAITACGDKASGLLIRAFTATYTAPKAQGRAHMFPHLKGFNLRQWIEENRQDWGQRRIIWQDSDFIAFVTRGPNRRKDFHMNPGDEIFHQLEGRLNLHYITADKKHEIAVLDAGDMFLLPGNVPHSPRRGEGSWTLVVERKRRPDEQDRFVWFCERCNNGLYETSVRFDDPTDAIKEAHAAMNADATLRKCRECGDVLEL
jgi:3-hydroxyanthranilate 3,4-dioxygenase